MPLKNRAGERFGRLRVLRMERLDGQTWAVCRCDCGQTKKIRSSALRAGTIKSCGCFRRDYRRAAWLKHDEARPGFETPEYIAWCAMKKRCKGRDDSHKRIYVDRGITVCDKWRDDFAAFLADVGRRPSPDHSIDRFPDNNGNYEPGNVRWATRSQQAKNRRPRPRDAQNRNWIGGHL